jgi:arylsulfatase A-like enzyme
MTACSGREQPRSAIIIVIDALRADHLGTYGYQRPTSPHLDEWAREGRVFERAYSTSTWTLPSLASLHTGQFPSRHGAGMSGFDVPNAIAVNRLSSGVPTLAEAFAARGFTTGAAVNNPLLEPAFGLDRGFQTYDHPGDRGRAARRADEMVDRAVALVDRWRDRSFFLLLHFIDPHMDYDAPAPFGGRFSAAYTSQLSRPVGDINRLRQRLSELTDDDREFIKAAYDEEIAFVDQQLGRLRSALATRGVLGRSLMMVTADHGEEFFEHGGLEHGHAMWEEVLHVPFIIWGPGVRAGREASPVSLADVKPTLLEWIGVSPPAALDGVSLWPNLTTGAAIAGRTLLAEGRIYGRAERMMLRWPLKVVVDEQLRPQRVTDLSVDPGEQRNLLDTVPEAADPLVADLRARLAAVTPNATSQQPKGLDPGVLERLRSLGYIR